MTKLVDEIMKKSPHICRIKISLVSRISIEINCCKNFFVYDPETLELEIHKDTEEEREYLDNPIFSIKEKDIEEWEVLI